MLSLSTTTVALVFGTAAVLHLVFQLLRRFHPAASPTKTGGKALPFTGDFDSFFRLTHDLALVGGLLLLTYLAENHPYYDHAHKSFDRDLFYFVVVIFFAYAYITIEPNKDLAVLGRAQTEEWKGWMQFIFLIYHYFHAEEVYNPVRVMITSYVWMTGFGNFSFFYIKEDFGFVRMVQMMWRLNFAVLLLCMVHNNTYILYYICPLHTFFFLLVYVVMRIFPHMNRTKWAVRLKLFVAAIVVFLVWDTDMGLFNLLFGWLGTKPMVGAPKGTLWEWYFRSSLDHWSTLLGMTFALNFPLTTQFFEMAEKQLPRGKYVVGAATVALAALFIWWCVDIFPQPKLEYNMTNAYFGIVPMTAYIFIRNCTPFLRGKVSMGLHELGKTTLETYLLQHHLWLTSNAKTILTIIPDSPYLNFAVCTLLFFMASKLLYKLTLSLRAMVLPDDRASCLRNCAGVCVIFLGCFGVAALLQLVASSIAAIIFGCLVLTSVVLYVASKYSPCALDPRFQAKAPLAIRSVMAATLIIGLFAATQISTMPAGEDVAVVRDPSRRLIASNCLEKLSSGTWHMTDHCSTQDFAYCTSTEWAWLAPTNCGFGHIETEDARVMFKNKLMLFVGDSTVRNSFHAFASQLAGQPTINMFNASAERHADIWKVDKMTNTTVGFIWAPLLSDIQNKFANGWTHVTGGRQPDAILFGATLWDALNTRSESAYTERLTALQTLFSRHLSTAPSKQPIIAWLVPTRIVDEKLGSPDKRVYMTEAIVQRYRSIFRQSGLMDTLAFVVDGDSLTEEQAEDSSDGVHYTSRIYKLINQVYVNGVSQFTQFKSASPTPAASAQFQPKVGSMASPLHGLGMLCVIAIALFFMDSFFGLARLSLLLIGGADYNYEEAFKMFAKPASAAPKAIELPSPAHRHRSDDSHERAADV